jgi:hypothetical protein
LSKSIFTFLGILVSLRFSALAAWYIHILSPPLPPIEALFLFTAFFINVAPKP